MNTSVLENTLNEFIKDYHNLVNEYVSKREYDNFFSKHKTFFASIYKYRQYLSNETFLASQKISQLTYENFQSHNEKYIEKALIEHKEYFDTMFIKYGKEIFLDEEQRRAILADDDYSLIIAGAGSGKTTTMAAKVKYLVDIKKVDPNEIVVLSYTTKAVSELKNIINQVFNIPSTITTFHSLAFKIINQSKYKTYTVYETNKQKEIIIDYISKQLFPNKEKMNQIIQVFSECFAKGFIKNYEKFNTFEEYFEDYKKRKYEKEKNNLPDYIKRREEQLLLLDEPMGLDLITYKSKTEAKIANFLYKNSIEYHYERPYFEKVGNNQPYNPDFTCIIHGRKIFLEYFGLTKYSENGLFTKEEIARYNQNKKLKIDGFKKRKDHYITLERNEKSDELLFLELRDKLKREGFEFIRRSDEEIFEHLIDEYKEAEFFKMIKKILDVIGNIKETTFITPEFKEQFKEYLNTKFTNPVEKNNKIIESKILLEAYNYYNLELARRNAVDFTDMITKAYYALNNKSYNINFSFKYLLVDEYQDISKKRFLLTKEIADTFETKIIAVGDDWQTIYTFAGSNIELFYNFSKFFPNTSSYNITRTYRNSQELIDIAGDFVQKNKQQRPKSLISFKHCNKPIEIDYYLNGKEIDALCIMLDKLSLSFQNKKIAILTRRNKTIKEIKRDERFQEGPNNSITYIANKSLDIELLTIHKAKGTTFDEVIIIDLNNEIFPSKGYSKSTITDFIEHRDIHENYPFAEERRLFYVALTRTKNKVYLLTPSKQENRCIFVTEIQNNENVITKELNVLNNELVEII